jgi:hypothetical protein
MLCALIETGEKTGLEYSEIKLGRFATKPDLEDTLKLIELE